MVLGKDTLGVREETKTPDVTSGVSALTSVRHEYRPGVIHTTRLRLCDHGSELTRFFRNGLRPLSLTLKVKD